MATLLSYALTSLSDVKESLGIASSDTSKDNLITRKINQATRAIEAYCGRRFALTTYTNDPYSATGTDQLILRQRPITQFTSLSIRDSGLNYANWEDIDSQLYFVDSDSGILKLVFNAVGMYDRYRVTYTAGYATIPEDLAEACASLATFYYNTATGVHVALSTIKEGQRELQYSRQLNTLNFSQIISQLGIDEIINSYANSPVMTNR